jgi:GntR family transcriptional regulator/MocR family aminotransferase
MERRSALVDAIQTEMGGMLEVAGAEAGLHLVALLPRGSDDVAVSKHAAERGVSVIPLSSCHARAPARSGLILGYGGTNLHQIREGVAKLKLSVQSALGR